MKAWCIAIAVLVTTACSTGNPSDARERYNEGVAALGAGEPEKAAEAFLEARDEAGGDGVLRWAAAYDLGLAHAQIATAAGDDAEKALASLRTAAGWFRDAVRLRPEDDDARANLEIVLRRAQILADQINKGKNGLEARLDRLIADQRQLRDDLRDLSSTIDAAGARAEPAAFATELEALATAERTLFSETGTVADLAADELGLLGQKDPEALEQQELVRQAQLQALSDYLQRARFALDDVRRTLRKLDPVAGHDQATVALQHLKRAREQLLDPVAVLRAATEDESLLLQHSAALARLEKGEVTLGDDAEPAAAPSWLTTAHLAARQRDVRERVAEIATRFRAAVASPPPEDPAKGADPEAARAIAAAGEALPHLDSATEAMQAAVAALDASLTGTAAERETEAIAALLSAMERFSGLRPLIELAHREQLQVVALLDPEAEGQKELSTDERARLLGESLGRNVDRLERLEDLLVAEKSKLEAEAAGQAQPGQGGAGDEALAAIAARFTAAETHRKAALDAVTRLAAIAEQAPRGGAAGDALALAREGQAEIEELRRLFFSIVEHLKDLLRRQGATHDRSAEAQSLAGAEMLELLGPAADQQVEHAALADALAAALAEQADAAAASDDEAAAAQADTFARASQEVRAAAGEMHGAEAVLLQAREDAALMSVDLGPALEHQPEAMRHLEEAIRILQPPRPQPKDQEQQERQQDPQEQQQQVSRDEAQRRLQAIREREAKRRKEKRGQPTPQPVDKDW